MNRTLRLTLPALLLCLAPAALHAGTPPPDPQAAAHRTHAATLAAKYDYAAAIAEYRQAYDLDKTAHLEDAALDLNKIGRCYFSTSQYPKALDYFGQELALERQIGDKAGEAITLSNIGAVHRASGKDLQAKYDYAAAIAEYQQAYDLDKTAHMRDAALDLNEIGFCYFSISRYLKALDYYGRALPIQRQVGDKEGEAATLNNIGMVYEGLSQHAGALDFFEQALPLWRQVGNKAGEASALSNIGLAYDGLSQYAKALDFFQQALPLRRQVEDKQGEAVTLNNIGGAYGNLSQYDKALDFYGQALPIQQQVGDRAGEAVTLSNIGLAYRNLSRYDQALDYYQQALPIERQIGDKANEATTLNNIGMVYDALSRHVKALDFYGQALPLRRQVGDKAGEAATLNNIGLVYEGLSQYAKALNFYGQALPTERQIGDRANEATTLSNLMFAWKSLGKGGVAVFYGKESVTVKQSIRRDISTLDKESQKSYLAANADTYRVLADLLIGQGRLPEAQQVLGLLKQQELKDFLRGETTAPGAAGQLDLTPAEQEAEAQYRKIADQVVALGRQKQDLLDKEKQGTFTPADQTRLDTVQADLVTAAHHLNTFLTQLAVAFRAPANADFQARLESVKKARDIQDTLRRLHAQGQDVVVLETVVAPDRYAVIVTTAQSQKVEQYVIKDTDLNKKVADFQSALRDPHGAPRGPAHELYTILVAPVEKDLAQAGAKTLMWSLDGTLRYVPVAALYDGHQYLVERFDNEVFTLGSQSGFGADERAKWEGLGMGVSLAHSYTDPVSGQQHDFAPLQAVPAELQAVILSADSQAGVVPGEVLLDPQFTQSAMTHALEQGKYNLVHVASHFALRPGDPDGSFLLLGDGGHLSLTQMADDATLFQGVDLLSLSACDTATGGSAGADGKEVDSLGTIAQQDGAKSILASLWPVSDASTRLLMQGFYQQHEIHAGMTKAEALRQAQLSLLHGGSASPAGDAPHRGVDAVPSRAEGASLPPFMPDPKAPYAHPFYWAPFILIGNWR